MKSKLVVNYPAVAAYVALLVQLARDVAQHHALTDADWTTLAGLLVGLIALVAHLAGDQVTGEPDPILVPAPLAPAVAVQAPAPASVTVTAAPPVVQTAGLVAVSPDQVAASVAAAATGETPVPTQPQ